MHSSVEKREILSHRKIFREINALVTSKLLISRNFCQKSMRENFHNFHTRAMHVDHDFYGKINNFPSNQYFTKEVAKS